MGREERGTGKREGSRRDGGSGSHWGRYREVSKCSFPFWVHSRCGRSASAWHKVQPVFCVAVARLSTFNVPESGEMGRGAVTREKWLHSRVPNAPPFVREGVGVGAAQARGPTRRAQEISARAPALIPDGKPPPPPECKVGAQSNKPTRHFTKSDAVY